MRNYFPNYRHPLTTDVICSSVFCSTFLHMIYFSSSFFFFIHLCYDLIHPEYVLTNKTECWFFWLHFLSIWVMIPLQASLLVQPCPTSLALDVGREHSHLLIQPCPTSLGLDVGREHSHLPISPLVTSPPSCKTCVPFKAPPSLSTTVYFSSLMTNYWTPRTPPDLVTTWHLVLWFSFQPKAPVKTLGAFNLHVDHLF